MIGIRTKVGRNVKAINSLKILKNIKLLLKKTKMKIFLHLDCKINHISIKKNLNQIYMNRLYSNVQKPKKAVI